MMALACKLTTQATKILNALESIALLAIRLWMGEIFLQSGWNKLQDILNGNMDSVVELFEYVHPVPGIPAEIAAPLGTAGEVGLGVLLVLGLGGRFAAAGLLVMTIFIQLALPQINTHMLWGLLFAVVMTRGSGLLSLDALIGKFVCKPKE